jgi:DNA (cytosine-5)-methyltransferase 3A
MVTTDDVTVTSLAQYLKLKKSGFEFQGQSYLFWEFVRILKEVKPKYFLLENVKMDKMWEDVITKALGVKPIAINSSLVSAQNRERLYWTNIPDIVPPKDKGIKLSSIIKGAKGYGVRGRKENGEYVQYGTSRKDGKSNCLTTNINKTGLVKLSNGKTRELTFEECEQLQTVPVGYTNIPSLSKTARYKMIGNGWTVDVISHILSRITK